MVRRFKGRTVSLLGDFVMGSFVGWTSCDGTHSVRTSCTCTIYMKLESIE